MMAWRDNLYSQVIAGMKVLLPLAALGLLSTMFLLSRTVDPTQTVPFLQGDVERRAQEQGISSPSFAGVTETGDQILFSAKSARPDPDTPTHYLSDDITAQIRLTSGTVIDFSAELAKVDQKRDAVEVSGNIRLTSTTGYVVETENMTVHFNQLHAETAGAVRASGPPGEITAGKMLLTSDPETDTAQLRFTDGVKLIYKPEQTED